MLKAIYIGYDAKQKINDINRELKDCKSIIEKISTGDGQTILIVDTVTRKDKLEKLNEISNEK